MWSVWVDEVECGCGCGYHILGWRSIYLKGNPPNFGLRVMPREYHFIIFIHWTWIVV